NVALPMYLARTFDARWLGALLSRFGLEECRRTPPSALSGGEAARAGLAVALACAPTVLLADEPTGELDAASEQHVLEVFDEHRSAGAALMIATHSEALASRADRVLRLQAGRLADA